MLRSFLLPVLLLLGAPAFAGPPVQLASPPNTPFTGWSLVLADFDGANGPDLAGVSGANVVISTRQPGGTFAPEQSFPMGATVNTLRSADLDGDGRPDLVAAAFSARALVVRRNLGGLAFAPAVTIPTGGNARELALGDLNGDGRPDAVTTLFDSAAVAVSLNDGAGNLQLPFRLAAPSGTGFVEIGDFTGDGDADIVSTTVVCPNPGCIVVSLFRGHGDGSFDAASTQTFSPSSYRLSIASGDLDGDGDLDLVLYGYGSLVWLRNQGGGTFDPPVSTGLAVSTYDPGTAARFAVGDVDGDGHPDIGIVTRWSSPAQTRNFFLLQINRGDGTFFPAAQHHIGVEPKEAAFADLDGDGHLDVVATTNRSQECCVSPNSPNPAFAWILRNTGHGTFDAHVQTLSKVWMPARRSTGPADLVGTASARLLRARNRGHGTFLDAEDIGRGAPWRTTDLDGDGDDELLVTSGDSLWVLLGSASGNYGPPSSIQSGLTPRAIADFTGDGHPDLAVTDVSQHVHVLPGDGAGGLAPPIDAALTLPFSPQDHGVVGADLNGDGRAELLFVPPQSVFLGPDSYTYLAELHVAMNDGAAHFGPPTTTPMQLGAMFVPGSGLLNIALGDFDGDDLTDVVLVAISCGNDVSKWWGTWRGLGGGVFATGTPQGVATNSPCAVASADLNGDGFTDFVRTNGSGGNTLRAYVHTANGDGTFTVTHAPDMGDYPEEVYLADMDGDAKPDVVTRSARYDTGSIRRNVTVYDLPTPALLALVSAEIADGAAYLEWFAAADAPATALLERRTDASAWSLLAPLTADGGGSFRYADRALPEATRVGYRLRWSDAEGTHLTSETWLDLPSTSFALSGAWPNPAAARPTLALSLPRAGAVEVEVFDLGGRRVARERIDGLAAGPQRITLAAAPLSPGVYVARVAFAGRRLESRFVVLE